MFWGLFSALIPIALMVKVADFKTCSQSSFCNRQKAFAALADYGFPSWSVETYDLGEIVNLKVRDSLGSEFNFKIAPHEKAFRISVGIDGAYDQVRDYALESVFDTVAYTHEVINSSIIVNAGKNKMIVNTAPKAFNIQFWKEDRLMMIFNERGYLHLEKNRDRSVRLEEEFSMLKDKKNYMELIDQINDNPWDESFASKTDTKPKGNN